MLNQGIEDYDTPGFTLSLVRSSQTIVALRPKGGDGFDFAPRDLLPEGSQNGYLHLGDLTLRLRLGDSANWTNYSTATVRAPVRPMPAFAHILASADLAATMPADIPLQIVRTWAVEEGRLVLRFRLTNKSTNTGRGVGHPHDLQQYAQQPLAGAWTCLPLFAFCSPHPASLTQLDSGFNIQFLEIQFLEIQFLRCPEGNRVFTSSRCPSPASMPRLFALDW